MIRVLSYTPSTWIYLRFGYDPSLITSTVGNITSPVCQIFLFSTELVREFLDLDTTDWSVTNFAIAVGFPRLKNTHDVANSPSDIPEQLRSQNLDAGRDDLNSILSNHTHQYLGTGTSTRVRF